MTELRRLENTLNNLKDDKVNDNHVIGVMIISIARSLAVIADKLESPETTDESEDLGGECKSEVSSEVQIID